MHITSDLISAEDQLSSPELGNLLDLTNGLNLTKIDIKDIRTDGSSVWLDFESIDGGDISFRTNGQGYTLDCTTGDGPGGIGSIELIQGTDEEPTWQLIYMFYSEHEGAAAVSTSPIVPEGIGFAPIAYVLCPTATMVAASGTIFIQRITDTLSDGYRSALSYEREKLRLALSNNRITGCEIELQITTNAGSQDNVTVISAPGSYYQLHLQRDWEGYTSSSYGIRAVGQEVGECTIPNYSMITDLGDIRETSQGEALVSGDSLFIDIIGIGSSCSCQKLGFVVSPHKSSSVADVIESAEHSSNLRYPKDIDQICFTIGRIVLTYTSADSGTWTNALSPSTNVWKTNVANESTPSYPGYPNGSAEYFGTTHTYPGATLLRVHFRDFNTEANYDYVRLRNAGGTDIYSYHGSLGSFTSASIGGDTVRFYFQSDGSVTRNGAYIDYVESYEPVSSGGGEVLDRR